MLSVIMYHHINSDDLPLSNSDAMMESHLKLISQRYTTVFPGEEVNNAICLTYDDAYYDFYYYVFPLLKKYNLKTLLAVLRAFIAESTKLNLLGFLSR